MSWLDASEFAEVSNDVENNGLRVYVSEQVDRKAPAVTNRISRLVDNYQAMGLVSSF